MGKDDKNKEKILGQSNNFHRKNYMKLVDDGVIKQGMGPAEQKRILNEFYTNNLGLNPSDSDLTMIHDIGYTKLKNTIEKEQGKREILSKEEKQQQQQYEVNKAKSKATKTGNPSSRKKDRNSSSEYEKWKMENGIKITDRSGNEEGYIIANYIKHLRNNTNLTEKAIDNKMQGILREQERVYRKDLNRTKEQKRAERKIIRNFGKLISTNKLYSNLTMEDYIKFNNMSNGMNKVFKEVANKNNITDSRHFQMVMTFGAYLIKEKGASDFNDATVDDLKDFMKYMKTPGNYNKSGLKNTTLESYRTAINKYSTHAGWTNAEAINTVSNKDIGLLKTTTTSVERAATMEEARKALELAYNGDGKRLKPNECVGNQIALMLGIGLRSDEVINLTYKQLRTIFLQEEEFLKLIKTKGRVPRDIAQAVLKHNEQFIGRAKNLLITAAAMNLKDEDKVFIEVYPDMKAKVKDEKTHACKWILKNWITNNRDKFQDKDRLENRIVSKMIDGKSKDEIDTVIRADLTAHSFRHTFANNMFQHYETMYNEKFDNDNEFKKEMFRVYAKERTKSGKGFSPRLDRMEYYQEKGYYIFLAKQVSQLLGHGRYSITETYIVSRDKNGRKFILTLNDFKMKYVEEEKVCA